ncbi:MAG: GNAT family N-acetyltransferase [Pseudomonadota bacterium]
MSKADIKPAHTISCSVHSAYPEDLACFEEKFRLFPHGCFVLETGLGISGYGLSHAWDLQPPPQLNALIGALPMQGNTYFIHDLTLTEACRGNGFAGLFIEKIITLASSLGKTSVSLVSVGENENFWRRYDFHATPDQKFQNAARSGGYGVDAVHMTREIGSGHKR